MLNDLDTTIAALLWYRQRGQRYRWVTLSGAAVALILERGGGL